jgi:hypothetical protein
MASAATARGHSARPGAGPGWIGFRDFAHGSSALDPAAGPALVARGTLLAEFAVAQGQAGRLPLISHVGAGGTPRLFSVEIGADGRLVVLQRQGAAGAVLTLAAAAMLAEGGRMRLNYRWDAPANSSLLTLEALDKGLIRQAEGAAALALPRHDLLALLRGGPGTAHTDALGWMAVAQQPVPVGPGAAFAPSTPIATPEGTRAAGLIAAGDWVETADAGPQQVVWSGRLCLPALGRLAPVLLRAPYFGLARDLWVLPQTRIAVSGAAVEYLFGVDAVLVEARHLVDGITAETRQGPRALGWQGILLRGHHLLIADGARVESLFLGGLAAAPDLAATTALAGPAAAGVLPLHRRGVLRELCSYEAASLAAARARARAPLAA